MTDTLTIDDQLAELDAEAYAGDEFSAPIGADPDGDVSRETSEINTPPAKKKPGPAPNPNSARSRRRAAAAAKAATPRKRTRANGSATATATAAEPDSVYERGALAVLGWVARPLALAGMALSLSAIAMPTKPDGEPTPAAIRRDQHGQALALDCLTLTVHGPALAKGAAPLAESIPWMAATLEKAAKVSPVAALAEAGAGILLQMLANHGLLPATPVLGTLGPDELRAAAGVDFPAPSAG